MRVSVLEDADTDSVPAGEVVKAVTASEKRIVTTELLVENSGDNSKLETDILETVVDLSVLSSNIRRDGVDYSMVMMVLFH